MDAPVALPPTIEPKTKPAPLLPPVLLGSAAILWLWVLPIVVLLALNFQGYWLIEGNMNPGERGNAHLLGIAGLLNALIGIGLCIAVRRLSLRNPESAGTQSAWWGVPALAVQVGYLWLAMSMDNELLPRTVTDWIYPPQRFLYNQFAFAMLPLFWGMTRLACVRPAKGRGRALLFNLGLAIGAPVMLYAVFQVLRHMNGWSKLGEVVMAIVVILLGLAMFVGLIRGLALGLRNVDAWSATGERIAIVLFALAMPVGGLLLNREIPFPNDFQAWEVYALTAANAAFLMLASWQHARRPLLSLGLLCSTLPFTLYFFVVFLPFLPLSILAVVLMGAGFLVLTPTVLLILHLGLLNKARRGSRGRRLIVGVLCFSLLPGFFTVRGLADKAALNAALDHVYSPVIGDGPIEYPASRANLRRALSNHHSYKNGIYYPLLSDYYAWLVFDHLVLPDDKLARLETAFFGTAGSTENSDRVAKNRGDIWGGSRGSSNRDRNRMPRSAPVPRTVEVEKLDVTTKAADGGATVVSLTLTLRNTGELNAEYIKTLPLPAGVYVSGFRLHIDGRPVPGRITEKKTALWVYTMIRDSERRDPGLLFYNAPDELELRVFPVVAKTPSIVEIDFLVPAELPDASRLMGTTDAAVVLTKVGELLRPRMTEDGRGNVVVSGLEGLALPQVRRERYFHLIVDRSDKNGFTGDIPKAVKALRAEFGDAREVRVSLANYEVVDLKSETESLDVLPLRGGFLPDLALARAIRLHRDRDLDATAKGGRPPPQPVFVILSGESPAVAPKLEIAAAWRDLLPGVEVHHIGATGMLLRELVDAEAPVVRLGNSIRPLVGGRVVRFEAAKADEPLMYWDPNTASWRVVENPEVVSTDEPWARATALQLKQQDHDRTPGDEGMGLKTLVKASRESGVMIASTSYIVVENAAQWRMLDVSERKKLDQNAALDFKEAPAPPALWLIAGFGAWLGFRRWRAARGGRGIK